MDAGWAKIASDWLQFVVAGGIGGVASVWAVLSNRETRRAREQEAAGTRIAAHAERLTRLEHVVAAGPTREHLAPLDKRVSHLEEVRDSDMTRLHSRIDTVTSGLSEVRGELRGITGLLRTIDQYLRDRPQRETE